MNSDNQKSMEPQPDHTYQRCWTCQRLLEPVDYDPVVDYPPIMADRRFCSDTCSIAYTAWYRRKWDREHPTRGDGTTSLSLGFEQSLLDAEKERAEPQGEPGWMPLKLRTDL